MMTRPLCERIAACASELADRHPGGFDQHFPFTVEDCCDTPTSFVLCFDPLPDWMHNVFGNLHGGMIATLLDHAMGVGAALYTADSAAPTISLQVSYLRPTPLGKPLRIRVRVTKPGRNATFMDATLWCEDEARPLATATGVYHMTVSTAPARP